MLQMDGLSSLDALEDLWLCRNRLTEIGDGLPLGRTLREINLAHNRLGCFKELLAYHLTQVQTLGGVDTIRLSSLENVRGLGG